MAYNHRHIFQFPLQVNLPPVPLPATVTSFPAPHVDQTPPPPPPLHPIQEAGDVHLQVQLYAVQLQVQVLAFNVAQQDYPAEDEDDDKMMVDEVDDYGSDDEK
ncbi:hypothetical protein EC957_011923 [Mortierella hygrophila]|uniref:Uncharacterized protein n=1 Tax=Mortierella hygrophila TaxID=979708 RepID=A0A9P6K319_9FUNG|nr:hypothetical protein EC957_011923 [Mortierella hygrophila]